MPIYLQAKEVHLKCIASLPLSVVIDSGSSRSKNRSYNFGAVAYLCYVINKNLSAGCSYPRLEILYCAMEISAAHFERIVRRQPRHNADLQLPIININI